MGLEANGVRYMDLSEDGVSPNFNGLTPHFPNSTCPRLGESGIFPMIFPFSQSHSHFPDDIPHNIPHAWYSHYHIPHDIPHDTPLQYHIPHDIPIITFPFIFPMIFPMIFNCLRQARRP